MSRCSKTPDRQALASCLFVLAFSPYTTTYTAAADNALPATSQSPLTLDEVLVTARKRNEALQDTPVAVSAFSAEALEVAGIANTRDLQESVPGLIFSEMGNKAPSIFIRGVGQKEASAVLDPGVGVYINSIYIARTDSQLLDVVDASSIQVLRGPQGTLFGKNNTGGAVLLTTRMPDTKEYGGEVSTRLGNHGRHDLKVSGNLPLIEDKLAARVSLNTTNLDGYLKNTYNGNKYGDEDRLGATARLYWQPTETFSTDVFYYWSKIDENGAGLTCFFQNPGSVFNTFTWPGFTAPESYQTRCGTSESEADDDKIIINGPSKFEMTNQILSVTANWKYDKFEIKSITAWSHQDDIRIVNDSDATDIPGVATGGHAVYTALQRSLDAGQGDFSLPNGEKRDQYTQELQLSGHAFDERLSFTTGIFVSREEIKDNLSGNLAGFNGYSYKADAGTLIPKVIGTRSDLTNDSYAIFAEGTYDVTDWYQLTIGTRFTTEKRKREATLYESDCEAIASENLVPGASGALCAFDVLGLSDPSGFYTNPPSYLPIRLVEEYETLSGEIIRTNNSKVKEDKEWSKWTPTITNAISLPDSYLRNTVFDSTLVYFTYSKGFKSGGFEMKGLEISEFEPESVTNYELGLKLDAFDQRIRFNTAFYYMDYDDIQIRITEQGRSFADILLFIDNAGAATIQGFEMELTALPLPNVILSATTSYTDASYDEFIASDVDTSTIPPTQSVIDRSNEDFAAIPKLTYSLSAMAVLPTAIGDFAPRLSMYYRDSFYTGLDATAWEEAFRDSATIDDVTLWNFRIGYTPANHENIQLWLYVDNLTDEQYFQGGFSNTESLGAGSYALGPPRSYGLEASITF
ncbi:Pesticin receptor [Halioglobus japonicus]|nr:Pesticin receptor [Halioglobus japonicus]